MGITSLAGVERDDNFHIHDDFRIQVPWRRRFHDGQIKLLRISAKLDQEKTHADIALSTTITLNNLINGFVVHKCHLRLASRFGISTKKHKGNNERANICSGCCNFFFTSLPSPVVENTSVSPKSFEQRWNPTDSIDNIPELDASTPRVLARTRRRGSSVRLRQVLPPRDFSPKELARSSKLSQPPCSLSIGCVSQTFPEPGWRVTTKPSSREFCFTSPLPLYTAKHHSPLCTESPFTIYFEGDILCGNNEDTVCLALGFVAGKDRVRRTPGFARGSIGVQCRDGHLYLDNNLLNQAGADPFEAGDHLGFGLAFLKKKSSTQKGSNSVLSPSIESSYLYRAMGSSRGRGICER